jgi:hypothetical protein
MNDGIIDVVHEREILASMGLRRGLQVVVSLQVVSRCSTLIELEPFIK